MDRQATLGSVVPTGKRWAARYDRLGRRHTPGRTFTRAEDAWAWLRSEQVLMDKDTWTPPAARRKAAELAAVNAEAERAISELTLDQYARLWIDKRTRKGQPLSEKTKYEYRRYLEGRLKPLAAMPLAAITQAHVEAWWDQNGDVPTMRHHCYALLKSVMAGAVKRALVTEDPCQLEDAAGRTTQRPAHEVTKLIGGLSHFDIAALADAMPEHHRALVLLLAYSGLRPGEALALTREDVHQRTVGTVPRWFVGVTKAVSRGGIGPTNTRESVRTVPLPPHVAPALEDHLQRWAAPGQKGLLFQSSHAGSDHATVGQVMGSDGKGKGATVTGFNAARVAIARPNLWLYDLRRWARYTWRRADVTEYECERLLGHRLGAVTDAYFVLEHDSLWPHMDRISEQAGWQPPAAAPKPSAGTLGPFLAALDDATLAQTLGTLDAAQVAELVPQLPPERIAAVLGHMASGGQRPALRVVEGGAQ